MVAREELLEAGMTSKEIRRRVEKGALIPQYRGVYRVGHAAPSALATYSAAVKAGGAGALLCGRSAAYLLGILRSPSPPPPEVLTTTERRIPGVKTRRTRHRDRRDATEFNSIPVTTVPRALVDLAAAVSGEDLARACHEAGVKYGTTPTHVKTVLERRPGSRGAAKLRKVMSGDTKVVMTRYSWRAGLKREREARKRGDEFRRYDYEDVFTQPAEMLQELRDLLT